MNKTTLIFAGLALFAASCSETEIVSTNTQDVSESINFSAYANKLTKALQTDVTTANLTSFKVTAIGNNSIYFDNETFTKSASGVWESLDTHIWPNYALDFYAYNTPENVSEIDLTTFVHFINNGENKNLRVTPAKELANQEDFVVAKALNQTQAGTSSNENHAVNLTFKHY
ncbi:MAG: fimbrillin family protein, partial [Prevotella sp.]